MKKYVVGDKEFANYSRARGFIRENPLVYGFIITEFEQKKTMFGMKWKHVADHDIRMEK